jgi:hypothetical protein
VIGDETLSSTSAFNLCQCVARSATTSSFICYLLWFPLCTDIGSYFPSVRAALVS